MIQALANSHGRGRPVAERFWELVDKAGPVPPHAPELGPCWMWLGVISSGYGILHVGSRSDGTRRHVRAHRLSLVLHGQDIPARMFACHRCDNRACVNPSHLFVGTQLDNVRDMISKDRRILLRGKDHRRAKLSEEDVAAVFAACADPSVSLRDIALRLGVRYQSIQRIVAGKSWSHLSCRPRERPTWKRKSNAKITAAIAREIFSARHDGRMQTKAVARTYGVSFALVAGISRRESWADATADMQSSLPVLKRRKRS